MIRDVNRGKYLAKPEGFSGLSQEFRYSDTEKGEPGDFTRVLLLGGRLLSFQFHPQATPTDVTVQDASFEAAQSVMFQYMGGLAELAPGNPNSLSDIIIQAGNASVDPEESVQGEQCKVIKSVTKDGTIRMWLSPSKQWSLLRATLSRTSNDLFNGEPLSNQKISKLPGNEFVTWDASIDEIKLEQVEKAFIPVAGTLKIVMKLAKGDSQTVTYAYKRSSLNLNPGPAQTQADIKDVPNGTKVIDIDKQSQGINFIWKNGSIVASIPMSAEDSLTASVIQQSEPPKITSIERESSGSQKILVICLVAACVVLASIVWGAKVFARQR
jgi:hypothetical protein